MSGTTGTIAPQRRQLLARSSATDTTITVAGVTTGVLWAGDGPPMVLLHGPGEFGGTWLPVLDDLARTHRVIAPDLPGHGASDAPDAGIDVAFLAAWLGDLIDATCPTPPVLVGRGVGGAIAAEFAARHSDRITQLVLVDTMGLAPFDPDPRFGLALHRFLGDPNQGSYERLMDFCAFDLDTARNQLGDRWVPYSGYAVELARDPRVQAATGAMIGLYGAAGAAPRDAGVDHRADHPHLGAAGRRDRSRRRRRRFGALRLAVAGRRRRRGRPAAGPSARVPRDAAPRHRRQEPVMTAYDVIVVGARCAGSPTAMLLARRGLRVLVVDRARFPSDTVSTHIVHPPGVTALQRWGLSRGLSGCPPIDTYFADFGPIQLSGAPGTPDSPVAYAPRRTHLDEVLVEGAVEAGVEVRQGFTVSEVLVEDGRVVGIRGRDAGGTTVTERARVVIGADGIHSVVAEAVRPEQYREKPKLLAGYYGYWSGLPMDGRFDTYVRPERGCAVWPTSDGLRW